jgi:hypothetical protein
MNPYAIGKIPPTSTFQALRQSAKFTKAGALVFAFHQLPISCHVIRIP